MSSSQEKLGAFSLGGGLLGLIVSVSVAGGLIGSLGGTTVSDASARTLLVIVVGGGILAPVLIPVAAYLLISQAIARMLAAAADTAAERPATPAPIAEAPAAPALPAIVPPSAAPAEI